MESNGDFACVHGALANLPCSSSNVGWEVVVSLLGLGGAVEEEVIVMTIMASSMPINNSTEPSGSYGHDNDTDAANYDLSPLDTPNITGDWIDNGYDEESESSRCCEERVLYLFRS